MAKVTFDGTNKLIIVNTGITELTFYDDVYTEWKTWVASGNSMYLQAIKLVGGEVITATRALGNTFFLLNGWRIRPYEGDHTLIINGNVYTDPAGYTITVPTLGSYNVTVNLIVSDIIESVSATVNVDGIANAVWDSTSANQIITNAVWNEPIANHTTTGTTGKTLQTSVVDSRVYNLIEELYNLSGLDPTKPLVVSPTQRTAGDIIQTITVDEPTKTTTVTRW